MTAPTVLLLIPVALAALVLLYWLLLTWLYTMQPSADTTYYITTKDEWRLQLHRFQAVNGRGEPIFFCHGLGANHWNFAMPVGGSLIDFLRAAGYDCWAIDLRGCRSSVPPAGLSRNDGTLDDYLFQDLPAALDTIREATGRSQVHWIGHSMGGMLLYAFEAAHGRTRLASGVTLGSPTTFAGTRITKPPLFLFLLRYAKPFVLALVRGLVPLSGVFRPKLRHFPINWDNLKPGIGVRTFFHLFDLPPYQVTAALASIAASRTWRMREIDVMASLTRLRTPLLAVYGAQDPLVSKVSIQHFFEGLPSADKKLLILGRDYGHAVDYNHVELPFGRTSEQDVYVPILDWLQKHPISEYAGAMADATAARGTGALPAEAVIGETDAAPVRPFPG